MKTRPLPAIALALTLAALLTGCDAQVEPEASPSPKSVSEKGQDAGEGVADSYATPLTKADCVLVTVADAELYYEQVTEAPEGAEDGDVLCAVSVGDAGIELYALKGDTVGGYVVGIGISLEAAADVGLKS